MSGHLNVRNGWVPECRLLGGNWQKPTLPMSSSAGRDRVDASAGGRKYRDAVSARYANGSIRHIHDRSFVTNCPGDDVRRMVGLRRM